jgi:uncharacterized OB-fold protein
VTSLSTRRIPLPEPSPLSEPFWNAVRQHRLTVQRCSEDGQWEWTPKPVCSRCRRQTLVWTEVSGRGAVYTYSIVRRPQSEAYEVPYVVAVVELEEGPRMMANVVAADPEQVRIGMPVRVDFEDFEELSLYRFVPA